MQELKVGIVGYGWVAGAHIKSLNEIPGVRVTSVCSRRELNAEKLSATHGGPIKVFNDLETMCKQKDLDIVSICTQHPLHPDQVEIAAAHGKHLIIEKPVAIDLAGLRKVEAAVARSGVKACICFEAKVIGHFKTMRAMIDKGLLGDIHYGECDYYHGIGPWCCQYPWNKQKAIGGSSLLTAGCHALDGLIWLMGSRPTEVTTYAAQSKRPDFQAYDYPTTTTTIMRFANGSVGKTASIIDAISPYLLNVHLCGSNGSIWNDKFYTDQLGGLNREQWSTLGTPMAGSGDVAHHPYRELFEDFVGTIREGKKPFFSFEDSIFSHRVCLAADMSAELKRPVQLAELA